MNTTIDYWRERFEAARAELRDNQRTIAELRELIKFAASEGITDGWRDAARAALERSRL